MITPVCCTRLLTNAKAYLQLSDTLPKSAEFSEDIGRQLSELREGIQKLEAHFRATLALREAQVLGSDRDNPAQVCGYQSDGRACREQRSESCVLGRLDH